MSVRTPLVVAHRLIGSRTSPIKRANVSAPTLPKMFENGPPQDAMNRRTRIATPAINTFANNIKVPIRIPMPPFNNAAPMPCAMRPGSANQDNQPMKIPRNTSLCMSSFGRHDWNDSVVLPWMNDPMKSDSKGDPLRRVILHMNTNHSNITTEPTWPMDVLMGSSERTSPGK